MRHLAESRGVEPHGLTTTLRLAGEPNHRHSLLSKSAEDRGVDPQPVFHDRTVFKTGPAAVLVYLPIFKQLARGQGFEPR